MSYNNIPKWLNKVMKALRAIERINSFAIYYLSREYEKCLSIRRPKEGNNINNAWQHVIFIYFYMCKIDRPMLIAFSKISNIFIRPRKCLKQGFSNWDTF